MTTGRQNRPYRIEAFHKEHKGGNGSIQDNGPYTTIERAQDGIRKLLAEPDCGYAWMRVVQRGGADYRWHPVEGTRINREDVINGPGH